MRAEGKEKGSEKMKKKETGWRGYKQMRPSDTCQSWIGLWTSAYAWVTAQHHFSPAFVGLSRKGDRSSGADLQEKRGEGKKSKKMREAKRMTGARNGQKYTLKLIRWSVNM